MIVEAMSIIYLQMKMVVQGVFFYFLKIKVWIVKQRLLEFFELKCEKLNILNKTKLKLYTVDIEEYCRRRKMFRFWILIKKLYIAYKINKLNSSII